MGNVDVHILRIHARQDGNFLRGRRQSVNGKLKDLTAVHIDVGTPAKFTVINPCRETEHISTGSALPAARITNEDLARRLAADGIETSDEWIRTRTGIEARRFVNGTTETTTTLAAAAAQKALEGGGVDPKTIDLIIVATTTPDQVFPSTAAAVQRLIGAAGCAAFDVQAVCAGFIYALNAADAMLRAGPYQRALVIGAETMSRVIDMKDRATCVLFGDGAGAVVLEASAKPGILAARMYADAEKDRKSTRLNSSHIQKSRMPSSA